MAPVEWVLSLFIFTKNWTIIDKNSNYFTGGQWFAIGEQQLCLWNRLFRSRWMWQYGPWYLRKRLQLFGFHQTSHVKIIWWSHQELFIRLFIYISLCYYLPQYCVLIKSFALFCTYHFLNSENQSLWYKVRDFENTFSTDEIIAIPKRPEIRRFHI